MAGGGDVRIIGANARTKSGVANVRDNALCVHTVAGSLVTPETNRIAEELFDGQVFNNVTTAANSPSVSTGNRRWGIVYIDLQDANTPTNIRLIAQYSIDGGSTWHDYSVDQWVDLRYVPAQITAAGGQLLEAVPLNYVTAGLFRLRAVAAGTTAVNTFTLSADVEFIS